MKNERERYVDGGSGEDVGEGKRTEHNRNVPVSKSLLLEMGGLSLPGYYRVLDDY